MKFDQHITFLPVTDLERSHAFYHDVLGLKLALDQGSCRIYAISESAFIGVCARDEAQATAGLIVTFVTDEVDAWHERLTDAGLPAEPPSFNPKYNIYHFFVRDPDGHLVEIQRFDDPRWRRVDEDGSRH